MLEGPKVRPVAAIPMIAQSLRVWSAAMDRREPVQPRLACMADGRDMGMLAPMLDSLFRLYAAGLGRAPALGDADGLSGDEHLLLDLIESPETYRSRPDCAPGVATCLGCALRSARIMLADHMGLI